MMTDSFNFTVPGGMCTFHTATYTKDELIRHYKRQRERGLPAKTAFEYARNSAHAAAVRKWMDLYD